jgi:hypothetical protein
LLFEVLVRFGPGECFGFSLSIVCFVPQSRLKGEPLRFLLLPGWLSALGGPDGGEPLGCSVYYLLYYPYYLARHLLSGPSSSIGPTIHGDTETFDPNLEPEDGDDEALDDVRVVRVRSIRVKTSADGAPHAEDLVGVIRETMQPAHVSLWLLPDAVRKGKRPD